MVRPRKLPSNKKERLIFLRNKEKQRRILINSGIENLRCILKKYGFIYYKSKADILFKSIAIMEEIEKQIDILECEKNMWKIIYLFGKKLENRSRNFKINFKELRNAFQSNKDI